MGFTPRPIKATGSDSYQGEVANNKLDIIDGELDDDIATLYNLCNGNLSDANIAAGAAISYDKLNLVGRILDRDIAANAAINASKINFAGAPPSQVIINNHSQILAGAAVWTVAATTSLLFTAVPNNVESVCLQTNFNSRGGFFIALGHISGQFSGNVNENMTLFSRMLAPTGGAAAEMDSAQVNGSASTADFFAWSMPFSITHVGIGALLGAGAPLQITAWKTPPQVSGGGITITKGKLTVIEIA